VFYMVRGHLPTAVELGEQVLGLAERTEEAFPRIMAHSFLGQPLYFLGRLSESLDHFERVLTLYDPVEHRSLGHVTGQDEGIVSCAFTSWCFWNLGYPDRAIERNRSAIELAREVEHPLGLAHALVWMAFTHQLRREREQTRERAEEAMALATQLGFPLYFGIATALRGWALAGAKGVEEIQRGLVQLAATGTVAGAPYFLSLLGEAQWKVGRWEDALGALDAALASGKEQPQPIYEAELHRLKGEVLLEQKAGSATREAESCFRRALEVSRKQNAKSLELRAATSFVRLCQREGRRDEARELLAPLHSWFKEGFETEDLKDAQTALSELS
jgi:predicted ATPase